MTLTAKKALRLLLWLFLMLGMTAAGFAIGLGWTVHDATQRLPEFVEVKSRPTGTTIRYFSTEGDILHSEGPAYGEWIAYDDIPITMRRAIVAIEDRRFRQHKGVDPIALARAAKFAWDNRDTGRRLQGASTITQQVARTLFLDRRYDIRRKIDEMIVALALEQKFTKEEILELYLNRIYLGGGAYGIDAAARTFFGHDALTLSREEAALLAGLAKAPSDYAPTADPEAAYGRMRVVLAAMRETGQDKMARPNAKPPAIDITSRAERSRTGSRHFVDWIAPQVEQIAPGLTGNIDVTTTLSSAKQALSQEAVDQISPAGAQSAVLSMEEDGAVRAMVGGLDYATSTYNRATQANRQPGSSFKLFVYLTALESGYGLNSLVVDAPISIGNWSPRNSSGRYSGAMPLQQAFAHSLNTVAAQLGQKLGTTRIAQMAHRLGISTPVDTSPSMVLGTSEVRLIDMTRAYATVASGGKTVVPYGIERIEQEGRLIYQHEIGSRQQVISDEVASSMAALLRGTVEYGTGRGAQIGRTAAGKTGTTNSNKDGWFVGFSSGLVTGVWVGRDDAKPIGGLQGGRSPAAIFANYMRQAVKGRPQGFETAEAPQGSSLNLASESIQQIQTPVEVEPDTAQTVASPKEQRAAPQVLQASPDRKGRSRAIRPVT